MENSSNPILSYKTPDRLERSAPPMRDGRFVVVMHKTKFPPRCAVCNADSTQPPVQLLIQAYSSFRVATPDEVAMGAYETRFVADVYFCHPHVKFRRFGSDLSKVFGGLFFAILFLIILAGSQMPRDLSSILLFIDVATLVLYAAASMLARGRIRFSRVSRGYFYLAGFGQNFLDSLQNVDSVGQGGEVL